jgi:hypothetical protein
MSAIQYVQEMCLALCQFHECEFAALDCATDAQSVYVQKQFPKLKSTPNSILAAGGCFGSFFENLAKLVSANWFVDFECQLRIFLDNQKLSHLPDQKRS